MTTDERRKQCSEHLANPQFGDYWHECYTPVCVVIGRTANSVVLCRKTKSTDENRWTWDVSKVETLSLDEFAKWLRYSETNLHTWALVDPGNERMKWVREEAIEAAFGEPNYVEFDACLMGM